jgi:hypothetical protein
MLRLARVARPILGLVGERFFRYVLVTTLLCGCVPAVAPESSTPADPRSAVASAAAGLPSPSALPSIVSSLLPSVSPLPAASLPPLPSVTPPPLFTPTVPPLTLPPVTLPTVAPTTIPTLSIAPPTLAPSPTIVRATITSFVPESGPRGAFVQINGTGLGVVSLVLFGDVAAPPISVPTDTRVTVLVPLAAITSRIGVLTPSGVVTSDRFFEVIDPPQPSPTCPIRQQCLPTPSPSGTP